MDFSLTEEQTMLQDSLVRFVQNDYSFETREASVATDLGYKVETWSTFAELGWLGVAFAEADGGYGGSAVDVMVILEQIGRGLVVEPYLATVILAGGALKVAGSQAQKESLLASIIAGETQAAFAYLESESRFNIANVATQATANGDGYTLNGQKSLVLNGPSADFFIVSARTGGKQMDESGISLFVVPSDAVGLTRKDYATVDGGRACELSFEGVALKGSALLGTENEGHAVLAQVMDEAAFAVCAEAVGCMEVLYKTTVEYCKQREQFGQAIGKFQVLRHRMVDMFMEHEQAKSLLFMAAIRLDEGYGPLAQKAVSALKVQVGKAGRYVGQEAIQLHGGMGMTEELNVGHYFKRLTMINALFGNVEHHLKRYGAL